MYTHVYLHIDIYYMGSLNSGFKPEDMWIGLLAELTLKHCTQDANISSRNDSYCTAWTSSGSVPLSYESWFKLKPAKSSFVRSICWAIQSY